MQPSPSRIIQKKKRMRKWKGTAWALSAHSSTPPGRCPPSPFLSPPSSPTSHHAGLPDCRCLLRRHRPSHLPITAPPSQSLDRTFSQAPWILGLLPIASRHGSHPSAFFEMTSRRPGICRHGLLPNDVASGESKLCVACIPELQWRYSCCLLPDDVRPR
jgi:hypothetical protein